jgi:H+-transporting ATPase
LFFLGRNLFHLALPQVQTLLFLRLAAGGHLLLFVSRTKNEFWQRPYPSWQLLTAIVATQIVAVLMCGFGWLVPPLPWDLIGYVWAYIIIWMLIQDLTKLGLHSLVENRAKHKRLFLEVLNKPLHSPSIT